MLAARPVLLAAMASQARRNFQLTAKTLLVLQQGDITKTKCDAIVNAANERMLGGGGVDGAIHRAAGPRLREACQAVPTVRPGVRCPTGEARITKAFDLPADAVIHTVGPVYSSPEKSAPLLKSAYRQSLSLANRDALKTVAFPAISCGVYGYPYDEAAQIALEAAAEGAGDLEEVRFVLFSQPTYQAWVEAAERLGAAPPC